jgi:hypothetical protein
MDAGTEDRRRHEGKPLVDVCSGFSILRIRLPVSTGTTTAGRCSLLCRLDEFLNCAARGTAYTRSVNRDLDAQSVFAREGHVVAFRSPGGGGKLSGRWLPVLQIRTATNLSLFSQVIFD